jgi:hypothetical protein
VSYQLGGELLTSLYTTTLLVGVVKLNKGIPPRTLSLVPYEIIVPLGCTNTTPPERIAIGSPHFT